MRPKRTVTRKPMSWICLLLAGLAEVGVVVLMKKSDGFRKIAWTAACMLCMGLSLFLLSRSLADIPIGTAYSIWTGIGAAGATIVGAIFYRESRHPFKMLCIALIIAGVVGLRLTE